MSAFLEQSPRRIALGQDAEPDAAPPPPFVLVQCPECSYYDHERGGCVLCENGDELRAECLHCVDGKPDPGPWYKRSEIVVPIAVSVVTTVLGAVATYYVMKRVQKG